MNVEFIHRSVHAARCFTVPNLAARCGALHYINGNGARAHLARCAGAPRGHVVLDEDEDDDCTYESANNTGCYLHLHSLSPSLSSSSSTTGSQARASGRGGAKTRKCRLAPTVKHTGQESGGVIV